MKKHIGMVVGMVLSISAQAADVLQADAGLDTGLRTATSEARMNPDLKLLGDLKLRTMKAVSDCLYAPGATNDAKRDCIEKVAQAVP